jgi:citrate lyase subunit alpha / citrate CoA-transferase
VTTQLTARSHPKIVDRVACVTTPGETIDVVVTDEGVAVNPRRSDLRDRLLSEGVSLVSIEELREKTKRRTGDAPKEHARGTGRVVAVAEYRDGTVIDVIEGING